MASNTPESPRRPPARSFQDLLVWEKAHDFVLAVYKMTEAFPKSELYGLTSQLRLAAVSIPANIAEGFRKQSLTDKARFLNIAEGSVSECHYCLLLSHDLHYAKTENMIPQIEQIGQLLNGYRTAILKKNDAFFPTS